MVAWSMRFFRAGVALVGGIFAAASATFALGQSADQYPNRAIKILVPYSPGGATDIVARFVASKLPEVLGQPVLVENRAGASGNIALDALAVAPPDGYTLLVGNVSTNAINETTNAKVLRSRPSRDLTGVTNLIDIPHVLVVGTAVTANTVKEFVDLARAKPGGLNYSSTGIGTYPHLDMIAFTKATGTDMAHIAYNGAGPIIAAIAGNQVQITFLNLASALPHIRGGKMKVLAVVPDSRLAELPNAPTMAESGYPGVGTNAWQGMFAPAGTPPAILDRLYAAVAKVMLNPEVKDQLAKQMMNVSLSKSPQDYTEWVREQTKKWGDFIKLNDVKVE